MKEKGIFLFSLIHNNQTSQTAQNNFYRMKVKDKKVKKRKRTVPRTKQKKLHLVKNFFEKFLGHLPLLWHPFISSLSLYLSQIYINTVAFHSIRPYIYVRATWYDRRAPILQFIMKSRQPIQKKRFSFFGHQNQTVSQTQPKQFFFFPFNIFYFHFYSFIPYFSLNHPVWCDVAMLYLWYAV